MRCWPDWHVSVVVHSKVCLIPKLILRDEHVSVTRRECNFLARQIFTKLLSCKLKEPLKLKERFELTTLNASSILLIRNKNREYAFYHVHVEKDSTENTSFVTPGGPYDSSRCWLGWTIQHPSLSGTYIDSIFKDLVEKGYMHIYMDDLLIHTATIFV